MPPPNLPSHVAALATQLARLPGALAVVLGGSRATATHRPDSDWDLGVYYRGSEQPLRPRDLRRLGHAGYVSDLQEWGPIMNGGAWLTIQGTPVDVLYRDLDTVERWLDDAQQGRFEVLAQNGYIVGAPTYLPIGELAICRPLSGELPGPDFPAALAETAAERWNGKARVALMFAHLHASAADAVACSGMLAQAVLSEAHARLAQRREWVVNEKNLVHRAGLDATQQLLAAPGATTQELADTVVAVSDALGAEPLTTR
jgi:predicted nucleotidyltransferase